jgi:two-component system, cell cycle sensor histidine kinase and response regulator CckA
MARVLIAEDQDATRATFAAGLKQAGHHVVEAADGLEALGVLKADPSIDLLLSDVDMPGMTGVALAKAALQIKPALPIILMSAHGTESLAGAADLGGALKARLTKPLSLKDLNDAVAKALA